MSGRSKTLEKSKTKVEEFSQKSKFLCLFCGGKSCSKENYLKNPHKNAIHGLNSDWITPEILAMQRPSSRIIKDYGIIGQFQHAHIKAVFNLQLPGEHPYCGDKIIKESGFTYKPEEFTDNGIFYFNFGWTDMEVTSLDHMIKILTHIDFIISQGMKVSVHCHAGTGRTGLLIASWLILKFNMTAIESRDLFRSKRAGGLTKSKQLDFLKNFEAFIISSRKSFQQINCIKIEQLIQAQEKMVFGKTKTQSRYQPHIMYQILNRLEFLLENNKINASQLCHSFYDIDNKDIFGNHQWSNIQEQQISQLKEQINTFQWQFSHFSDVRVLSQVLLDFFDQKNLQVIKNESAIKLNEYFQESKSIEIVFADESIVQLLGRYEYFILSKFLEFILRNLHQKNLTLQVINQFILRICISLLGKRQELDHLFIQRSFLNTECSNQVVFNLYQYLNVWLNEMVQHDMVDNTYFDRIFNRTACIIEGKEKQFSYKKNVQLSYISTIKKSLQTKPEHILVGQHIKNDQSEYQSRRQISSEINIIDIRQQSSKNID
ncbi:hypothetical protein ABPG72_010077 [Tetrahymena utriculariae]